MQTERDSFVFYRSFYDSVKDLTDADFAECMRFLCEYALNGEKLQGSTLAEVVLKLAKPQIDANNQRRANGTRGGRPKGSGLAEENQDCKTDTGGFPSKNQTEVWLSDAKPNVNVNEYDNANEYVNGNENANANANGNGNANVEGNGEKPTGRSKSARPRTFQPPSLADVQEYCAERGNRVDAERFVDFYAAKGWMIGKNSMKDWKAAVRNWEKQDAECAQEQRVARCQGASNQSGGNDFLRMLAEMEGEA